MRYNGIYRVLSDQDSNIDCSNKGLSLAILSSKELEDLRFINKQRPYRYKHCLWCGGSLDVKLNKTGKEKNYCDAHCNRLHSVFAVRLETDYFESTDPRVQIFREYCLIQMIFRVPCSKLYERLKKISKRKESITLSKNTPLLLKTLTTE